MQMNASGALDFVLHKIIFDSDTQREFLFLFCVLAFYQLKEWDWEGRGEGDLCDFTTLLCRVIKPFRMESSFKRKEFIPKRANY